MIIYFGNIGTHQPRIERPYTQLERPTISYRTWKKEDREFGDEDTRKRVCYVTSHNAEISSLNGKSLGARESHFSSANVSRCSLKKS